MRSPVDLTCTVPGPITVRASARVRQEAIDLAVARISTLLDGCPGVAANLTAAAAELQLLAESERVTDLPQYLHMRGVPFDGEQTMDERGRGYGGLHACCGEESLLCLPSSRHSDHRDICSHELAHTVLSFGLDETLRDAVEERYEAAMAAGLWKGAYASTNAHELFAEATMWWVGSRGDYGPLNAQPGRAWLEGYDPETAALLTAIYTGERVPEPVAWEVLNPESAQRSRQGEQRTEIVFVNHTTEDLELHWLDYEGLRKPYGVVRAGCVRTLQSWQTHPFILIGSEEHGPYVSHSSRARATITNGARS